MNWRVGFLRLWIVLTGLWVIVVSGFLLGSPGEHSYSLFGGGPPMVLRHGDQEFEFPWNINEDVAKTAIAKHIQDERAKVLTGPPGPWTKFSPAESPEEVATKVVGKYRQNRLYEIWLPIIAFTLAPPVFLFAFGAAFTWVVYGFRRT